MPVKRGRKKTQVGGSVMGVLRSINRALRKTKAISRVGNVLSSVGVPYAGSVANVAGKLGYGKRRGRPRKM